MKFIGTGLVCLLLLCRVNDAAKPWIAAADAFEAQYKKQNLEAHAAGTDCKVLLLETETRLDNAAVESMQYGVGDYDIYEGGAEQFAEDKQFRAVVYRDGDGRLWTYGATTRDEARDLPVCR